MQADASNRVEVIYWRDDLMETFSGTVEFSDGLMPGIVFAGMTWEQVLEFASDALRSAPGYRLLMKRQESFYPVVLPESVEKLLRTDLPAAIRALTIAPQRVELGAVRNRIYYGLRRGYDTLADALGEEIYLRVRQGSHGVQVEDPISGRWSTALAVSSQITRLGQLQIGRIHGEWVGVKTEDVLTLHCARYYLPRKWNPSQSWITHDLLAYMYDTYRKEKSDVDNG